MTSLIACLGAGKGTWAEVSKLIASQEWTSVFLITNDFGKENFSAKGEFVIIDDRLPTKDVATELQNKLRGKINDTEVAINFVSGSGNVHMALIAALLRLGLGIRLVSMTNTEFVEL